MKPSRLVIIVLVSVIVIASAVTVALFLASSARNTSSITNSTTALPSECVKPSGGFLIVASNRGYNDSVDHGVPTNKWPVITVQQGQTVNITVCNTDFQTHGFQIAHYYDNDIFTVVPGQAIDVSFVASEKGDFQIYCEIPCTIHWAMQSGELIVN